MFRWSLNSLFSETILRKLSSKAKFQKNSDLQCTGNEKYRTIDGTCNNIKHSLFGSAPSALTRLVPAKYFDPDGLKDPIGFPGQHDIPDFPATLKAAETFIKAQRKPQIPRSNFSHLLMQYGQFLDHDLSLSPEAENSDRCICARYAV